MACTCRGGLYGRPDRATMTVKPSDSGGLVWRGVGTPPYGPGRSCVVGAASSRPNRLGIISALSPNLVGRHAHMPPWPGAMNVKPGNSVGAVRAAIQAAPTDRIKARCRGRCPHRPAGFWVQGSPALFRWQDTKTAPRQRAMEDGCVCGARFCVL